MFTQAFKPADKILNDVVKSVLYDFFPKWSSKIVSENLHKSKYDWFTNIIKFLFGQIISIINYKLSLSLVEIHFFVNISVQLCSSNFQAIILKGYQFQFDCRNCINQIERLALFCMLLLPQTRHMHVLYSTTVELDLSGANLSLLLSLSHPRCRGATTLWRLYNRMQQKYTSDATRGLWQTMAITTQSGARCIFIWTPLSSVSDDRPIDGLFLTRRVIVEFLTAWQSWYNMFVCFFLKRGVICDR